MSRVSRIWLSYSIFNATLVVFTAYGSLVSKIDDVGDYLRQQFSRKDNYAVGTVVEKLLDRSRSLLKKAHEYQNDPEKLTQLVESVRADTEIFLDSCRVMRERGELSIENIRGGSLEAAPGNTVSSEDTEEIKQIWKTRYKGKYPPDLEQELQVGLSDALKSPYSHFYLYRKDGEIITYVRFDDLVQSNDVTRKHMASFMTNPKFEGGALGQALLEVALQKEMEKGRALYAECDPSLVSFYEKFGFRLLRSYKDDHGVETCDIVLEPESGSLRAAA